MGGVHPTLAALAFPVPELRTLPGNPRRGDVEAVARSYERFGQRKPIVARRDADGGGTVIAGNHQLEAARRLGWDEIAVVWVDDDDATAKAFALADNRTADLGSYDEEALVELLAEVAADPELLAATSYSEADLAALVERVAGGAPVEGATDPDAAPELPAEPISAIGDVWQLGDHRLAVGDSGDEGMWEAVLGGRRADLVWTDPPYGVDYVGKTADALTIANDALADEGLDGLLRATFALACRFTAPGACWYVAAPAGPQFLTFGAVLTDLGVWRQTLVWVKDQFVLGRSDYHYRHEPVFYGWTPDGAHRAPPDRTHDTVFEVARPRASREHPTMKPVELIEQHVVNSTAAGALVMDPFAGSGSTLIAAHRRRRVAALIELDPRYADVICRRFQEHAGVLPVRDGEPVDFQPEGVLADG